jgi:hypothetical protein
MTRHEEEEEEEEEEGTQVQSPWPFTAMIGFK